MKITKSKLRQIIMEELENDQEHLNEMDPVTMGVGVGLAGGLVVVLQSVLAEIDKMNQEEKQAQLNEPGNEAAKAAYEAWLSDKSGGSDINQPPAPSSPMGEEDVSLDELKSLIRSELLG
jgi:hypothetical protein